MNSIILFVTVILLSANQISAYCFFNGPEISDGVAATFCTYNGQTYDEGESWDTDNCEECHCMESGAFSCCGYGFHAGTMSYGIGCDIEQFDCLTGVVIDTDGNGLCEMAGHQIQLTRS
ncbi:beta-microseminoprotein A1-like [Pecten maximus]|uniref:beta-microseminoprotein A1-like n=1 Tax=Pecten maximus TaxID=6579 RepID=UPI0014588D33|nr:beta-microseminoprotein A1-like [Pecten maximus]